MFFKRKKVELSGSLNSLALRKFFKNKLSTISLIVIVLFTVISILGYLITPDKTPFSNEQYLELSNKKPGFKVLMLYVRKNEPLISQNIFKTMFFGIKSNYEKIPVYSYKYQKDKIIVETYTGTTPNDGEIKEYSLADVAYAIDVKKPIVLNNGYLYFTDLEQNNHTKSLEDLKKTIEEKNFKTKKYILGSDRYGRDMLSQLIIGTRVSLSVGLISVLISLVIGISLGAIAGYYRGWVDNLIVWFINVIWSIPTLLLVIAITFALGKGFWQVFIAVGLTMWVEVARVVRGQVMSLREKEFVEAGKALGFSNFRIIFRHILPNVIGAVIVISAANFASAILMEAGLSFLGIGVQPPVPSWGGLIKENYAYIILDSAYLAILPGIAIMIIVLAFMLVGNGLRDALDVRL